MAALAHYWERSLPVFVLDQAPPAISYLQHVDVRAREGYFAWRS